MAHLALIITTKYLTYNTPTLSSNPTYLLMERSNYLFPFDPDEVDSSDEDDDIQIANASRSNYSYKYEDHIPPKQTLSPITKISQISISDSTNKPNTRLQKRKQQDIQHKINLGQKLKLISDPNATIPMDQPINTKYLNNNPLTLSEINNQKIIQNENNHPIFNEHLLKPKVVEKTSEFADW